jgi:hypothetical protein
MKSLSCFIKKLLLKRGGIAVFCSFKKICFTVMFLILLTTGIAIAQQFEANNLEIVSKIVVLESNELLSAKMIEYPSPKEMLIKDIKKKEAVVVLSNIIIETVKPNGLVIVETFINEQPEKIEVIDFSYKEAKMQVNRQ